MKNECAMHVLIPTHGRTDLLKRTLASLSAAIPPASPWSVWVLENGKPCGARQVCREFADLPLRYEHRQEAGKALALQWAVEQINQGLLVFFDDDVRLDRQVLLAYEQAASDHGRGYFFGGPLAVDYQQPPPDWLKSHLPNSVLGWEPSGPGGQSESPMEFYGANMAMFAEDILSAGGFDTTVGPGAVHPGTRGNPLGQETRMQQRLLAHGAKPVFVPTARVWHFVPANRCSVSWALHRQFRTCLTYSLTHPPEAASPRLGPLPRWLWGKLAKAVPALLVSYLVPGPKQRFYLRLPWCRFRGYAAGWATARRSPKPSPQRDHPSSVRADAA